MKRLTGYFGFSRDFVLLALAVFCLSYAQQAERAIETNFQVEVLGIGALEKTVVEAFREIPGMVMVFIAAALILVSSRTVAGLGLLGVAVGFLAYMRISTVPELIGASILWSLGFHVWMPVQREMSLRLGNPTQPGRSLGIVMALSSAGAFLGMLTALVLVVPLGYRNMFLVGAAVVTVGALFAFRIRPQSRAELRKRPRFVLKREYSLYYWLTFLDGSARQVFWTLAIFVLIKVYGMQVQETTILLLVNNLITTFLNPRVGAWIDDWGERKALLVGYGGLIFVFVGFALAPNVWAAAGFYFVYTGLFSFHMAITSYLDRIAKREDMTSSLSMGVTFNHLAGLFVPIAGGLLYERFGHQAPFLFGAVLVVVFVVVVARMNMPAPQPAEPAPALEPAAD